MLALAVVPLVRRFSEGGADVAALLVSGWVSYFGASQLHGTPYPYGGMSADIARLTALATRFSVETRSADQFVKGLPAEYPPLFPWLVGRTSAQTGVPAWALIGVCSVVFCGLAVMCAYLLWRQLCSPVVALSICLIPAAVYGDPRKAHEVMALCVITPWALGALSRGRRDTPLLHWGVAGVVGGLLVTTYQGYLTFSVLALVVIVAAGLRRAPRWPYVKHLLLTAATALAVAGWFLGPWLRLLLRTGGDTSADLFVPFEARDPWHLPWMHAWPVAIWLTLGLLLLVGFSRTEQWARCLLAMALAAMAYRWVMFYRYEQTGHTAFFHYTDRLYDGILAIGMVLGLVWLWPWVSRPLRKRAPALHRLVPTLAVSAVTLVAMCFYWDAHRAGHPDNSDTPNFTRLAHAAELPGGGYPEFSAAAGQIPRFPAPEVRRIVERRLGKDALPTLLSYGESVSSFYPYYQYVGVGGHSANSLAFWPRRVAEIQRLSHIGDPATFAAECGRMQHGQIDVFVLRKQGDTFLWRDIAFRRSQFGAPYFHVERAFGDTWVFVRSGAEVEHRPYPH
jgi:hypothetical protein